jgi:protein-disulfide isomerase
MVMYEDFQCPFCLRYSALWEPTIVDEYVATGRVQFEFRQFPILGPESVQAAVAAECAAGQDRFWQYQNHLFLIQARAGQWSDEQINVGRFSTENLQQAASDVGGIDRAAFDACLASPETLAAVEADAAEARQVGIAGTPGFTFNGQPLGGTPPTIEDWRLLLDSLLAEVEGGS